MGRTAGRTKWDQAPPGDLDLTMINASLRTLAGQLAEAALPDPAWASHPATGATGVLADVADIRDGLAYWTRVLAEFSVIRLHVTQKEVARTLGISTQTINRWVNDPLLTD